MLISKLYNVPIVIKLLELANWDESKAVELFFEKIKQNSNKITNSKFENKFKQKMISSKNETIFTVSENIYYYKKIADGKNENKIDTDEKPLNRNLSAYQHNNYFYYNKNELNKSNSNKIMIDKFENKYYCNKTDCVENENNFSCSKKVYFNINEIDEENSSLLNDNIENNIYNNTLEINDDKKKYFNINEIDEENSNEIINENNENTDFNIKNFIFNKDKLLNPYNYYFDIDEINAMSDIIKNQNYYEEQGNCIKSFKSISIEGSKMIIRQMQTTVCKIKNNDIIGTGFFIKIPFYNNKYLMPVLLTNNHILSQKDLGPDKTIKFSINDTCEYNQIFLDDRKILTFEKPYDITLIEIKKDDGLDISLFLEVDERINDNNSFKKDIYLLQYPLGDRVNYSQGLIKKININNYNISHSCISEKGSSGGPIINLNNHKVIAIHKGENKNRITNEGTLISFLIKNLEEKYLDNLDNYRYNLYKNLKAIGNNLIKNDPDNEITIQYKLSKNALLKMANKINIFNKVYTINIFGNELIMKFLHYFL